MLLNVVPALCKARSSIVSQQQLPIDEADGELLKVHSTGKMDGRLAASASRASLIFVPAVNLQGTAAHVEPLEEALQELDALGQELLLGQDLGPLRPRHLVLPLGRPVEVQR